MKIQIVLLIILALLVSCQSDKAEKPADAANTEIIFDRELWLTREGIGFPHREKIYKSLFKKDTLKKLNRDQILQMLGEPSRVDSLHMFYRIREDRVGILIMKTTTLS